MGSREIEVFLTYLPIDEQVAASTQNQGFNALLFLYREVLKIQLDDSNAWCELIASHPSRVRHRPPKPYNLVAGHLTPAEFEIQDEAQE